jgi:rare lipoprotein A
MAPMNVTSFKRLFLLIPPLLLLACASIKGDIYPGGVQVGVASWYGDDFHGKPTASGEKYNMYAMTAAHRTLAFGTVILVTNLENNRQVKVTVNDRGPFVKGRIIDLSYAAFKKLERVEKGTARVRLEKLGRDLKYVRYIKVEDKGDGDYVVQLGAFSEERNAARLKRALGWKYPGVYVTKAKVSGKTYYRVRVGKFKTRKKAYKLAKALADEGYEIVIMRD